MAGKTGRGREGMSKFRKILERLLKAVRTGNGKRNTMVPWSLEGVFIVKTSATGDGVSVKRRGIPFLFDCGKGHTVKTVISKSLSSGLPLDHGRASSATSSSRRFP